MTLDETITILKVIKAEWPHSFKGITRQDADAKLNLWAEMFKDDDPIIVGAAVKALIVGGGLEFAPTIGAVKEKMRELVEPDRMTEMEAWGHIQKAMRLAPSMSADSRRFRNGVLEDKTSAQRAFDGLPPIVQRIVGTPSTLAAWYRLPTDEMETVVQSNFMRSYRDKAKQEREYAAIPADVKKAVAGVVEHLRLGDGKNDGERHEGTASLPGHGPDPGAGGLHEEQAGPD